MRHHPATCPNCTIVTMTADRGHIAAGIRLCAEAKAADDRKLANARATNPEIAKLHAMMGLR
jgi:hypothetical protein